jgi:hypothetical protein
VSFGNQQQSIQFIPNGGINNTFLIQPINNSDSSGISTSFYSHDTSSWNFYSHDSLRFSINGNGKINTTKSLFVNNASSDHNLAFRVNGRSRFDSTLYVRSLFDTTSFISFETNVKRLLNANIYDGLSAYTTTPIAWNNGKSIPTFRIRHPKNVANGEGGNLSAKKDFLILPYEFGMAIEYNGVVECWVGEWSIHKGMSYYDVEGTGNGWGGVFWVGDDQDLGGIRSTARDNSHRGGRLNYGEISCEKFGGSSHGDLRFRLPSKEDDFQFVYGKRGSDTLSAKIKKYGFVPAVVNGVDSIGSVEAGQLLFNQDINAMQYFDGQNWIKLNDNRKGNHNESSNGSYTTYKIIHTLNEIPAYFTAQATSADAAHISYITADNQYIYIHYQNPPPVGRNNLSWVWSAEK